MTRLRERVPAGVVVAAVYVVIAFLITIATWRAPTTTYVGEGPDPVQAIWGIGWVPFATTHGLNPLFSTAMNTPAGMNMLWGNAFAIPMAVVLWPMTVTLGATVSYNLVITLSLALAAFLAYLVIRRWVPGVVAAALGGLLYGFSPYMTAQYFGHLGLVLSAITPPLALMLLDEIVVRQRRRPLTLGLLAAGLTVLQFFITQEVLLTEVIVAAVLTLVLALSYRDQVRVRAGFVVRTLCIATLAAVVVLAYPTWLQFLAPGHLVIHGAVHGTDTYVTDAANFVVPTVAQLISPQSAIGISSHFSGNASEWDGYLGIPLVLILVFATVRFWQVPVIRTAGIVAAIVALLSLGPHLHLAGHQLPVPLPWWIPAHLPVLENILPARMMIYVFLAASITFAFLLRALWLMRSSFAVNALVALAVLLPLVPTLPAPATTLQTQAPFTSETAAQMFAGANVLFEPFPGVDYPQAMTWQRSANYSFTMLGGYVIGPYAPGVQAFQQKIHDLVARSGTVTLSSAEQLALASSLRSFGVSAVVVNPSVVPAGTSSLFTQVLGSPPVAEDGFLVWRFEFHHAAGADTDR
ncbi:MAG: hypothetical protein WB805_05980 [Candidatus Dormiibacterota bacterium]